MPKPYQPNDKWARKAKEEGLRARSAYKLQELNERFHMLKTGITVLDCGAAPGSWLQVASQCVGPKGRVIGVDRTPIEPIADNVHTIQADILEHETLAKELAALGVKKVHVVLSDLAPNTSGVRDVDQWRSVELNQAVMALADQFLMKGGTCVMKLLRGADFDEFLQEVHRHFSTVKVNRVAATRDRSNEVYIVGLGFH